MVAKKILENQPNLFLIDQPTILFGQRGKKKAIGKVTSPTCRVWQSRKSKEKVIEKVTSPPISIWQPRKSKGKAP